MVRLHLRSVSILTQGGLTTSDILHSARPAGFDFANGKVTIWGSGDNDISFTSQPDVARYVGYVLTKLPREKLENRAFYIEGDRIVSLHTF